MFWSLCSSKGGVGTSVVAAAVAIELAKSSLDREVVLVDFGGDQPDILGVAQEDIPGDPVGVVDWLTSNDDVGIDAIDNLLIEVGPQIRVLPMGRRSLIAAGPIEPKRCGELVSGLGSRYLVVADIGVLADGISSPGALIAAAGDRITAVLQACYLSLRRAGRLPVLVDDVVEVVEGGRSMSTLDVELVMGRPVSARITRDPRVGRAVDIGTLTTRLPRSLRRAADDLIKLAPADPAVTTW
ncbi:MAG: hypothetical protein ACI81L_003034 [Verrucomicrobiales bacterium]|jgi:hypothetical protein